jgi:hypothetical protein
MKSIKKAMLCAGLAIVAGVLTYQAFAVTVGGEEDQGSRVSVLTRDSDESSGSIARVGGLSVGGKHLVNYESKRDRVDQKANYDEAHNRPYKSYPRDRNNREYDRARAARQADMNKENQPQTSRKRGRTTAQNETRRTKRMRTSDNE